MIGSEEYTSKETTIYGRLVHYDGIFLIVACETCNGHNTIDSTG